MLALTLLVCVVLAALWALHAWSLRRYTLAMDYASIEQLATADGALIELLRLPPPETPTTGRPVLLVHGLGIDHRNNDPVPHLSLARHLRTAGRDVWLLRLRSGGLVREFRNTRLIRLEAMARYDVPLAVETVCARTGAQQLDYVGFSMGGILLYGALTLGSLRQERLARAVTIGSPARVMAAIPLPQVVAHLPRGLVPAIPFRTASQVIAVLAERVPSPLDGLVYNPKNAARGVVRHLMMHMEDIPAPLASDFHGFLRDGVVRVEGKDVVEGLGSVQVPVMFFAGGVDRVAPPAAIRPAYEAWGGPRQFVLLARSEGAGGDYGHGDLAFGVAVEADVFEPVARFFAGGVG